MFNMIIKDKTAIITGSSGKLGSAIAKALAEQGADCLCHYYKNREEAEKTLLQIRELGRKAELLQADLRVEDDIKKLFKETEPAEPRILINSAAVFYRQPLDQADAESAGQLLDLNLTTPILTAKYFIKNARKLETEPKEIKGKIINMADVAGLHPWAEYSVYSASKAGLIAAAKSLAKEFAPAFTVNTVSPGLVSFPDNFTEEQIEKQAERVPMKRAADYGEITEAVIFLLKNDYITGRDITVDGGRYI